mgnify:CR=1 FL=1
MIRVLIPSTVNSVIHDTACTFRRGERPYQYPQSMLGRPLSLRSYLLLLPEELWLKGKQWRLGSRFSILSYSSWLIIWINENDPSLVRIIILKSILPFNFLIASSYSSRLLMAISAMPSIISPGCIPP